MSQGSRVVEASIQKALVVVGTLSGMLVVSGFFFPEFVGAAVTGRAWLISSLLFFGSVLIYIALLPVQHDHTDRDRRAPAPYLVRLRYHGWVSVGRKLIERVHGFFERQDPITFGVPVVALTLFFTARFVIPLRTQATIDGVKRLFLHEFGWLFLGVMFLSVLYCLFLLVWSWGDIKLGGPEAEPTYTYPTYFAMFFTAGIAAGIVFWAPAEALLHYQTPPPYLSAQPQSDGVIVGALTYALFHYGFSAWSAYLVIGVPIAYFTYQQGAPLRVSTILTPFFGVENLDGYWAKLVDVLAIFATLGGVATSVAFVSQQFLAGINYQWGVTYGSLGPVLFVTGLILIYVSSAQSGVQRGIRRIAGVTVVLFCVFGLLVFAVGPRSFIVGVGISTVGNYVSDFVPMSLYLGGDWVANWTVWNWSWWFSWAPFAGLFLAALSKGRRIRTVVLTGGVATSAATIVWFLLLGGTSLSLQHSGTTDILGEIAVYDSPEAVAGFPMFAALPLGNLLMFFFLALIIVFIVTSADTSTLVVAILATKQDFAPTLGSIVFWGVLQGVVALSVLLVGGGKALQTLAVLTGGPFAVLSVVALVGLTIEFRRHERSHLLPESIRSAIDNRGVE